jgi:hypothetical protein
MTKRKSAQHEKQVHAKTKIGPDKLKLFGPYQIGQRAKMEKQHHQRGDGAQSVNARQQAIGGRNGGSTLHAPLLFKKT